MINTYKKIWQLVTYQEKKKAFILFLQMVGYGIVEMFGVVSIVPLVAVLTEPSLIESNRYLTNLYQYLNQV